MSLLIIIIIIIVIKEVPVTVLVRHKLVRLVQLEQVHEEPLYQGRDHRQVQAVSGQGGQGRRHEGLHQAGRSQRGDGALLLLLGC